MTKEGLQPNKGFERAGQTDNQDSVFATGIHIFNSPVPVVPDTKFIAEGLVKDTANQSPVMPGQKHAATQEATPTPEPTIILGNKPEPAILFTDRQELIRAMKADMEQKALDNSRRVTTIPTETPIRTPSPESPETTRTPAPTQTATSTSISARVPEATPTYRPTETPTPTPTPTKIPYRTYLPIITNTETPTSGSENETRFAKLRAVASNLTNKFRRH